MSDPASINSNLFKWLNTDQTSVNGKQVLDANEVNKAKSMGFSIFNLKENISEEEFNQSLDIYKNSSEYNAVALNELERSSCQRYMQEKYNVNIEMLPDETPEAYEARIKKEAIKNIEAPKIDIMDNELQTPTRNPWSMPAGTRYAVFDCDEAQKTYL